MIGGGPAGLIAAETLSGSGLDVTVYDRMPTMGRKFLMAGRGGLNLTYSEAMSHGPRYREAERFLGPPLEAFPPAALRAWAAGLGEATFVGSSGRVFPESLKASPLLRAWLSRLRAQGVGFAPRHHWLGWDTAGRLVFRGPDAALRQVAADATILALGGASWPKLGSDGGWTDTLEGRGVTIAPLRPANCGLVVEWSETFRSRFAGEPLKNLAVSFRGEIARGEATVTRSGLEGGAIYALSAPLREAIAREGSATAAIDLRPDMAAADLAKRLRSARSGQSLANLLRKAARLPPVAINLLREAAGPGVSRDPDSLAALLKALPVRFLRPQPIDRAISTAGGIALDELDGNFMLRRLPGVFAAGEMLDWEAPTGGYLLQACFSTGLAAATGALAWLAASADG